MCLCVCAALSLSLYPHSTPRTARHFTHTEKEEKEENAREGGMALGETRERENTMVVYALCNLILFPSPKPSREEALEPRGDLVLS